MIAKWWRVQNEPTGLWTTCGYQEINETCTGWLLCHRLTGKKVYKFKKFLWVSLFVTMGKWVPWSRKLAYMLTCRWVDDLQANKTCQWSSGCSLLFQSMLSKTLVNLPFSCVVMTKSIPRSSEIDLQAPLQGITNLVTKHSDENPFCHY